MPEYLTPGVFMEEAIFRQKSIAAAGTSATGFLISCRLGMLFEAPTPLNSFADFEWAFSL